MTTRREAKAATRQAIVEAARAEFQERGVRNVTTTDITRRAGLAAGTLYVHFTGKEALIDEIARFINRDHRRLMVTIAAQYIKDGSRTLIREQARAHIDFWHRHAADYTIIADYLLRRSQDDPLVVRGTSEAITRFADFVMERAAVVPKASPAELARLIFTVWRQAGLNAAKNRELDLSEAVEILTLSTIALYEALAPGLVDISPEDLASAYGMLVAPPKQT